jgi:hypothetical protein
VRAIPPAASADGAPKSFTAGGLDEAWITYTNLSLKNLNYK